jgi:hypothetical protein
MDETLGSGVSSVTGEPTSHFLPELRARLMPLGTTFTKATNTGVTITAEAHAELVTGRRVPMANFPSDDGAGQFRPTVTTLFDALRAAGGVPKSAVVIGGNTPHLQGLTESLHPMAGPETAAQYLFVANPGNPSQSASDDAFVISTVQDWMTAHPTRLLVVNLHQIDRAGHYNESPIAYADRVKAVDAPLAEFWSWIQAHPDYQDRTTLIIMADHGRHRLGEPDDHRHHGDSCAGCREIPLFMIGPGIRADVISDTPTTLADVGATIAALLQVELPLSTGRILREALTDPPDQLWPTGSTQPAQMGGIRISQRWISDAAHRSQILLDETPVSSARAMHAEAPVLVSREGLSVVCWREFVRGEGEYESWPWLPVCKRTATDAAWSSFRFPVSPVSAYFRLAMHIDYDGNLWTVFADNPTGNWEATDQRIRIHRWTAAGSWEEAGDGIETVRFPIHPALVPTSDGVLVAFISSDTLRESDLGTLTLESVHSRARYRRHIQVHRVRWHPPFEASVVEIWRSYTADHFLPGAPLAAPAWAWPGWAEIGRVDRPALGQENRTFQLAFLSKRTDDSPVELMLQVSTDEGQSWSDPSIIDDEYVAMHITPVLSGGALFWARSKASGVEICRWAEESGTRCTATGADAVDGLSVDGAAWSAGLRIDKTWQTRSEPW